MFNINGKLKYLAMLMIDAVLILTAFSLSVYLRFDWQVPSFWADRLDSILLPAVLINLAVFIIFGFYPFHSLFTRSNSRKPKIRAIVCHIRGPDDPDISGQIFGFLNRHTANNSGRK